MTSSSNRRSGNAELLKILEDGEFYRRSPNNIEEDHGQAPNSEYPPRYDAAKPSRQNLHDGRSHCDVDTRSHGSALESVNQPSYTVINNYGDDVFGSSVRSTHFTGQPLGAQFVDNPSGQPFKATLPAVQQEESDNEHSSVHYQRYEGSLPHRFASITTPPKFEKLHLNRIGAYKIDSIHQVVVFGGKYVGKTRVISCFSGDDISDIRVLDQKFKMDSATVVLKHIESEKIVKLNFWEANMQDMTQTKIKKYMHCEIAIVVYDVTNYNSLREANHCITTIKDNVKEHPVEFMLVGNKNDISGNNDIISKAMGLVNILKIGHRVTSAYAGSCMAELLEDVALQACSRHKEANTYESRFAALEKNLTAVQEELVTSRHHLQEAKQTIRRLEEEKERERERGERGGGGERGETEEEKKKSSCIIL